MDAFAAKGFYTVSAFRQEKALRAFICTNTDLASDEDILNLYAVRWKIEVFHIMTESDRIIKNTLIKGLCRQFHAAKIRH